MGFIAIGTIVNTHGVKGNVTVKTDSDFKEERYAKGNRLYIKTATARIPVTVESFFVKKTVDVLKFQEFNSLDAVENLKGATLEVDEADRELLEDDTYYYSDLIGLEVYGKDYIGIVDAIRSYPQGEVLVVGRESDKPALIPFRKEFIKRVSKTRIDIIEMEGLL